MPSFSWTRIRLKPRTRLPDGVGKTFTAERGRRPEKDSEETAVRRLAEALGYHPLVVLNRFESVARGCGLGEAAALCLVDKGRREAAQVKIGVTPAVQFIGAAQSLTGASSISILAWWTTNTATWNARCTWRK